MVRQQVRGEEAGRLLARPGQPGGDGSAGRRALGLAAQRDGVVCVPLRRRAKGPLPLLLLLHGAGGGVGAGAAALQALAEAARAIVVAPESRGRTWDVIGGDYGPDVAFIDRALEQVFGAYQVDGARLAIGGFSDGASYALSLGLANGDLFSRIIAVAPGFVAPHTPRGRPRVFICHGTQDRVLPIERCSRRIVPYLRARGYEVTYHEFEGGHIIPPRLTLRALRWLKASPRGGVEGQSSSETI